MNLATTISGYIAVIAAACRRPLPAGLGIPFSGVMVRATDVRRHRYLRRHKLPYSASMASVHIGIGK